MVTKGSGSFPKPCSVVPRETSWNVQIFGIGFLTLTPQYLPPECPIPVWYSLWGGGVVSGLWPLAFMEVLLHSHVSKLKPLWSSRRFACFLRSLDSGIWHSEGSHAFQISRPRPLAFRVLMLYVSGLRLRPSRVLVSSRSLDSCSGLQGVLIPPQVSGLGSY